MPVPFSSWLHFKCDFPCLWLSHASLCAGRDYVWFVGPTQSTKANSREHMELRDMIFPIKMRNHPSHITPTACLITVSSRTMELLFPMCWFTSGYVDHFELRSNDAATLHSENEWTPNMVCPSARLHLNRSNIVLKLKPDDLSVSDQHWVDGSYLQYSRWHWTDPWLQNNLDPYIAHLSGIIILGRWQPISMLFAAVNLYRVDY